MLSSTTNIVAMALVACCLAWSCGSEGPAGPADAAGDTPLGETSLALTPPEPPVLTPCPPGWGEVPPPSPESVATCEPWPGGAPIECQPDEAQFPGQANCTRLGTACGDAEWAEDLPSDRTVLYVSAGAAAGGAGTRESPYASIGEALAAAEAGTVIAVGRGAFDEAPTLTAGVTLWGACVAETAVAPSTPSTTEAALVVSAQDVVVRNLRIGGPRPGVEVGAGASLGLEDVLIAGAHEVAWRVEDGGRATGERVVIRDTVFEEAEVGVALELRGAADLQLSRALIEANEGVSVMVTGPGAVLALSDVAVRETWIREGPWQIPLGVALWVDGGTVQIDRAVFECSAHSLLVAFNTGTRLTANDIVVRASPPQGACAESPGLLPSEDEEPVAGFGGERMAFGLFAAEGPEVEISRALFHRSRPVGLLLVNEGSLALTDTVVRDTERIGLLEGAFGLMVFQMPPITIGGTSKSDDADAEEGRPQATLVRVRFEGTEAVGILANGPEARIEGSDVVVSGTEELSCGPEGCPSDGFGIGVTISEGAISELTRFEITGSGLCGLQLAADGAMDLHEGVISRNPVGVNLQIEGFDFDRLTDRVVFVDNERNLDANALPVPDPTSALR